MFVSGVVQDRHRHFEKLGVAVCVLLELATGVPSKKIGIFLVSQAIGGDVLGLQGNRFFDRRSPLRDRLAGQAEH